MSQPIWTQDDDQRLSDLVIKLHFNFPKISKELGRDEEAVRVHWTEIYLSKKNQPVPTGKTTEKEGKNQGLERKEMHQSSLECPRMSFAAPKNSVLDTSKVDFTQQTSRSITGDLIHPSGFNIFKHSLQEVFQSIFTRMKTYIPSMDFPASDLQEETEPVTYRVSFAGTGPVIESKRGSKGKWTLSEPSKPVPNYDDIVPIPAEDRPIKPPVEQVPILLESDSVLFKSVDEPLSLAKEYGNATKELAALFNLSETEVATEHKIQVSARAKTIPTRLDPLRGRGRPREDSDSDYQSEEEEAFIREQRKTGKRELRNPPKTTVVEGSGIEEKKKEEKDEKSDSGDEDLEDVMAVPRPYAILRQKELEDRAEAMHHLRVLEERQRKERLFQQQKAAEQRIQAELEEKRVSEAAENALLQAKREAKLQAKLQEEIQRKQQLDKIDAEVRKQLEEEQRKKTEERIRNGGNPCFFDPQISFEEPLSALPDSGLFKIIVLEDQPYVFHLISHFLSHSTAFGKADFDEKISFKLVGLVKTTLGGPILDPNYAPGTAPWQVWILAFDLNSSSIGFNAYLEGVPLAYVVPGGVPGKTFLKEIVVEVENVSYRHMILPVENVLKTVPGFYPYNDPGQLDYEYTFAVIKPHSTPSKSVQMFQSLLHHLSDRELDIVGCRLINFSEASHKLFEDRFGKGLVGLDTVLVLCIYGFNAIEELHEILGAETPDLARRTDPESVRAVFGESKERNCVYTAKVRQRVYRELCFWFGGRVTSAGPTLTVLSCPPLETLYMVFSPAFPCGRILTFLHTAFSLGYTLVSISRLSPESSEKSGFQPFRFQRLKMDLTASKAWRLILRKPGAHVHLSHFLSLLRLPEADFRIITAEENAELEPSQSDYRGLEIFSGLRYVLATPEAFIQTANSFPGIRMAEEVGNHCEIMGIKIVTGPFPGEIETDYNETMDRMSIKQSITASEKSGNKVLIPWLESGPNLLIAYLPDSVETGKEVIRALKRSLPNSVFSPFTKPSFILADRSGRDLISFSELEFDPFHSVSALINLPSVPADTDLKTVCVLKPDKAFTLFRQILRSIFRHGFEIVQAHMQRLTQEQADLLYSHQAEAQENELNYEAFINVLTAGPCVSLLLTRRNAIKKLKEIIGDPVPGKAELNSLRGSYGKSAEDNKLHCSMSFSHAQIEALRLFSGDEFQSVFLDRIDAEDAAFCALSLSLISTDALVQFFDELKAMQFTVLDLRIGHLPETQISAYDSAFPTDSAFSEELKTGKVLAIAVNGLSPGYRLETYIRSLRLEAGFRSSKNSAEMQIWAEIFFPPYPY